MLLRPSARLQHAWPTIAEWSENQPGAEAGKCGGFLRIKREPDYLVVKEGWRDPVTVHFFFNS